MAGEIVLFALATLALYVIVRVVWVLCVPEDLG